MTIDVRKSTLAIFLAAWVLLLCSAPLRQIEAADDDIKVINAPGMLWQDPTDIASRDLIYGAGGASHRPQPPFHFVKEDEEGTSPKFTVLDKDGVKWKVKLGQEARSETAASRFVWAAGYFTNEDYYLNEFQVQDMPQLHRGQDLVSPGGAMQYVRLKRDNPKEKKIGIWKWSDDGWANSRELNGLKVMMALVNNWDLKDINNAVYQRGDKRIFLVSDLGATFGSAGRSFPRDKAKDNMEEYWHSKFIREVHTDTVDFEVPARPTFVYTVNPKEYLSRVHMESIGRKIPKEHARWIGEVLSRLSPKQIRDAFRTAGYPPEEVEICAPVVENRIRQLREL